VTPQANSGTPNPENQNNGTQSEENGQQPSWRPLRRAGSPFTMG